MKPIRTFRLDRLYHQLLKPKNISISLLDQLVSKLYEAGFIEVFQHPDTPDDERYAETEKLTNRLNRDELFKLINEVKNEA